MTDKTQPTPGAGNHPEGETEPAAETTPPVQSLMGRFGQSIGGWRGIFYGALVQLLVLAILGVGLFYAWAWLGPHMVETYRTAQRGIAQGSADSLPPGRSGLIYVESPEVYTRQRLVNDRYLQDAWLNERLAEIDDDEAGWIDSAYVSELLAVAQLSVGSKDSASRRNEASVPPALPPNLLEQLDEVPFRTRFRLQSQARDNIRQLILENALDDRHDLSGNTIFGLKFDTSVLPADNTHLNPTVAVRMCPSELDQLLRRGPIQEMARCFQTLPDPDERTVRRTEDFLAHFLRFSGPGYVSFQGDGRTRDILNGVDDDYRDWRQNVAQRLESFRRDSPSEDCEESDVERNDDAGFCTSGGAVSAAAQTEIRQRLANTATLDGALQHVMRLSDVEARFGEGIVGVVEGNANAICSVPSDQLDQFDLSAESRAVLTVQDFLQSEQRHRQRKQDFSIPGAWGDYFRVDVDFLFPGAARLEAERAACPVDFDLELQEPSDLVFNILYKPEENSEKTHQAVVESMSGFQQIDCLSCDFKIFVHVPDGTSALPRFIRGESFLQRIGEVMGFALPPAETLPEALREPAAAATSAASEWRMCATGGPENGWPANVRLLHLDPEGQAESFWGDLDLTPDPETCVSGRQVRLRTGAYAFFNRMTLVESYTYAAFPRGDVSGVVRQVHAQTDLGLGAALPAAGGRFGLTSGTADRTVEEQPIVVNFASGQNRFRGTAQVGKTGLFDFGWSIVKSGAKEPMMTSQLVLLSVPAYLDEITLEYWTGFLDPNRIPEDREAIFVDGQSYNDLNFEERVSAIMDGEMPRTMTLRVPPDYAALDSIVIGRNEIFGPKIRPEQSCIARTVDGNLSAVIPGDRLWRSTVVTLGTERADRIEVMPDMRGIRATFQFRCAEDTPNCDNAARSKMVNALLDDAVQSEIEIRVWTSEGSDRDVARRCRPSQVRE